MMLLDNRPIYFFRGVYCWEDNKQVDDYILKSIRDEGGLALPDI